MKVFIGIAMFGLTILSAGCGSASDREANQKLMVSLGKTTVTVFPTLVRTAVRDYDTGSAANVAEFLNKEKIATAKLSNPTVPVAGDWSSDQSKMYRETVKSLSDFVLSNPIETEYAFMAEYLIGPQNVVVGIHWYVVSREGKLAAGHGMNSHNKDFAAAKPGSVQDCNPLLINSIRSELKRASEKPSD